MICFQERQFHSEIGYDTALLQACSELRPDASTMDWRVYILPEKEHHVMLRPDYTSWNRLRPSVTVKKRTCERANRNSTCHAQSHFLWIPGNRFWETKDFRSPCVLPWPYLDTSYTLLQHVQTLPNHKGISRREWQLPLSLTKLELCVPGCALSEPL